MRMFHVSSKERCESLVLGHEAVYPLPPGQKAGNVFDYKWWDENFILLEKINRGSSTAMHALVGGEQLEFMKIDCSVSEETSYLVLGGVLGAVVLIGLGVLIWHLCRKKKRRTFPR